jgi:hypothetical protein
VAAGGLQVLRPVIPQIDNQQIRGGPRGGACGVEKPADTRAGAVGGPAARGQNFWIMSKPSIVCWLLTPSL